MLSQMNSIKVLFRGRSAEIRDVLIDTSGVIVGIFIVLIIIAVYKALGEKYKTMRSVENSRNMR